MDVFMREAGAWKCYEVKDDETAVGQCGQKNFTYLTGECKNFFEGHCITGVFILPGDFCQNR